jgi:hypothetical protein
MHRLHGFFLLVVLLGVPARAQTPAPARDPNGVALAGRALQAITGGTALTDITLQAAATYIAGSDQETGSATLIASGNQQSRVTLNLTNGQRQEVRSGILGAWVGADGTAHATAAHNCFLDADWFFPALSLAALASDPTLLIALVGQEVHTGQPVYHLTLFHYPSGQSPDGIALVEQVSSMDLYLDTGSLMPVALDFNLHPDKDANVSIPTEIRFGAYQSFNGTLVPTRIQMYLQNALFLDLKVTNVAVNSGVPPTLFAMPSVAEGGAQ